MTNLQPNYQMIECDEQTAEQHIAMAEMMKEDEGELVLEQTAQDQTNLIQFSSVPGATYQKTEKMYSYEINNFSYYLSSFYSNISDSEINKIAFNVKHVVGKDPSLDQTLEKEISNIFKSNPATAMMDHDKLVEYLHNELKKLGFNTLEKVDILKFATLIRDPVTKETVVPFETWPTKTDEMKNRAWEKIH